MEQQKVTNLLGNIPDKVPKFIIKKWIELYDQSGEAATSSPAHLFAIRRRIKRGAGTLYMYEEHVHVRGTHFFTLVVHACTEKSQQTRHTKKNCVPQFLILSALKLTSCVLAIFVDMSTCKGISKHSWKKIMQLIWTAVTYSLEKC